MTTGDATDNTIAITTGSAATSITDNFSSDTVTVNATALAENTALTLAGLCRRDRHRPGRGHHRRHTDRGADRDHGQCRRQRIAITTGSGATSITASGASDTVTVDATTLAKNTALTLAGSAAEVVTGLVGNITASALTGTLSVTTGDATDNTIAITTGSAATSITDNFSSDTVTVNATALAQNTALTLLGLCGRDGDRAGRGYHRRFTDRGTDRDHGGCSR